MGPEDLVGTIEKVETHADDPTSPEDPWDTVAAEFRALGRRFRETYGKATADGGPTEDEVREALATLARAWGQIAGSVGAALQEPEVRRQVKEAASTFATAVGNTITDLGSELNRAEEE
jgi:hypothetical protein